MNRWQWLVARLTRRIWFRASLISALSILLALAARGLAPLIPYDLSLKIGAGAVDNILTILASSMLAVATFSIAAMVSAFNGAAQNVTPRATQLLIEDKTAQNALSTFIGAFLFGIVGIVALSTSYYGPEARAILFIGTILMIGWIAITLLRWIEKLTRFGRMADTIERVETSAMEAIAGHNGPIALSGRSARKPSPDSVPVFGSATGYVTHIDLTGTGYERGDNTIRIEAAPGQFVDPRVPLASTDTALQGEEVARLAEAFTIESSRRFNHDPRFGMVVLSEIASRALSPAVNDPGSAIAVLTSGQRVAEKLIDRAGECQNAADGSWNYGLSLEDMISDLVLPIARDGAAMAEVGIRLQLTLGSLAAAAPQGRGYLNRLAQDSVERARGSGMARSDLERVETAYRRAFPSPA